MSFTCLVCKTDNESKCNRFQVEFVTGYIDLYAIANYVHSHKIHKNLFFSRKKMMLLLIINNNHIKRNKKRKYAGKPIKGKSRHYLTPTTIRKKKNTVSRHFACKSVDRRHKKPGSAGLGDTE